MTETKIKKISGRRFTSRTFLRAGSFIFLGLSLNMTLACSPENTDEEIESKRANMVIARTLEGSWLEETCTFDDEASFIRNEIVVDYNNHFTLKVNLYRDSTCTEFLRTAESQEYQVAAAAHREQLLHVKVVATLMNPMSRQDREKIVYTKVYTIEDIETESTEPEKIGVTLIKSILSRPGFAPEVNATAQQKVIFFRH